MLPYVLMIAAAETEGLSQVRKGSGTTTFIEEGAVKNVRRMYKEMSLENGVVVTKKGRSIQDSVKVEKRTPNTTFFDLSERTRARNEDVHRINDAAMGATVNRQSEAAKQAQLAQTMAPQKHYVDAYHDFTLQIEELICFLIPRVLTEPMLIEMRDEFGETTGKEQK
jgi:hypothetical protein